MSKGSSVVCTSVLIVHSGGGNHRCEISRRPLCCMCRIVGHADRIVPAPVRYRTIKTYSMRHCVPFLFLTQVKIAVRLVNHEVKRELSLGLGVSSFLFNFGQFLTFTVIRLTLCDEIVTALEKWTSVIFAPDLFFVPCLCLLQRKRCGSSHYHFWMFITSATAGVETILYQLYRFVVLCSCDFCSSIIRIARARLVSVTGCLLLHQNCPQDCECRNDRFQRKPTRCVAMRCVWSVERFSESIASICLSIWLRLFIQTATAETAR